MQRKCNATICCHFIHRKELQLQHRLKDLQNQFCVANKQILISDHYDYGDNNYNYDYYHDTTTTTTTTNNNNNNNNNRQIAPNICT